MKPLLKSSQMITPTQDHQQTVATLLKRAKHPPKIERLFSSCSSLGATSQIPQFYPGIAFFCPKAPVMAKVQYAKIFTPQWNTKKILKGISDSCMFVVVAENFDGITTILFLLLFFSIKLLYPVADVQESIHSSEHILSYTFFSLYATPSTTWLSLWEFICKMRRDLWQRPMTNTTDGAFDLLFYRKPKENAIYMERFQLFYLLGINELLKNKR